MSAAAAAAGASFVGSLVAGDALGGMAQAKETAANKQQDLAAGAAKSPQEIAALEQQNNIANQNLQRQQKLVDSADPAIIEIGKQTLAMLRGDQTAGAVGVANKQRMAQRSQLEAQLRSQLGPGYANTSAGIAALNSFDSQSADLITTTQQNAIQANLPTLANISGNGLSQSAGLFGNLSAGYGNAASRLSNAYTGTASGVIGNAGGDYVRQLAYASAVSQSAGTLGSAFAGGGAGGAAPMSGGAGGNSPLAQRVMPG